MKVVWVALVALVALVGAISWFSVGGGSKDDSAFLKNLRKGVQARWELTNFSKEKKMYDRSFVKAELDAIGDLAEYTFKDEKLKEYAEEYVAALHTQLGALAYKSTSFLTFGKTWNEGMNELSKLLVVFVDTYGLKVSSKYEDLLEGMMVQGRQFQKKDDMVKAVCEAISSESVLEALGGAHYEVTLFNPTEIDLNKASLSFNFFDENGTLVKNGVGWLDAWPSGSKIKHTIIGPEEFKTVEMQVSCRHIKDTFETAFIPLHWINNLKEKVKIKLDNVLPCNLTYDNAYNYPYTKCLVTDFSFPPAISQCNRERRGSVDAVLLAVAREYSQSWRPWQGG